MSKLQSVNFDFFVRKYGIFSLMKWPFHKKVLVWKKYRHWKKNQRGGQNFKKWKLSPCYEFNSEELDIFHFWQTLSRSPKSKSRLTTGFSLKSDFPTPSHTGKVSKKQDTVIYPKQKLLVYIRRLWNRFWNKPRPKNHPLGVKKGQRPFKPRLR